MRERKCNFPSLLRTGEHCYIAKTRLVVYISPHRYFIFDCGVHQLVIRFTHYTRKRASSWGSVVNAHIKFMYSVFLADFIFRIVMYDSIFILYKSISVRDRFFKEVILSHDIFSYKVILCVHLFSSEDETNMAESVELPSRLAILPFRNKVLLPGAIIRIRCTSPTSVKLVEQELWQREEKGMIGILPVRDAAEVKPVGPTMSQGLDSLDQSSKLQGGSSDSHKLDAKNQNDVVHWHNRGVAARALHLSRGVEKPSGRVTYIVVLEGLCRFSVQELSTRGTYHTARISSLEMTKTEMEQVEQDPDFIMLSRQFKATAMELISLLEQKQKTGGRTKVLLETVPVHKLADIFVASFEISFEEQLSMLDSVDPKVRLSKATELVDRHLQVSYRIYDASYGFDFPLFVFHSAFVHCQQSIRVAEKISQKVEGQLSKSQKEFLLRQQET
ncbi:hypothetical protein Ahy_Scaffold1g107046 isoform D [Arachis hypogaea]|uniref:Lon N-terminal domain-containing protein n=1 Tax=Arachis hypogaea TaxID=3818 RepID=A0A444WUE2_ARAHY|nr:hypothetical protein Ahy_Scaffold1g107046 isoform D [Arachis hypogaea]